MVTFRIVPIVRKTNKPFQFSDGSFIPPGTFISIADTVHRDESVNPNPFEFKPFRYAEMREVEGEGDKHQMVSLERSHVSFGTGRHAWFVSVDLVRAFVYNTLFGSPGRFFAATEIKTMVAHVLMNYDVKFKNEGVRPENEWFGSSCAPNRSAEVLFRKRQV
jgi:hypothetical protein